jgi:hypothetical protein
MSFFQTQKSPVHLYIGFLIGLIVSFVLLLVSAPSILFQLFSIVWIGYMVKQSISYIYTQIPQHISVITVASTLIIIGFSYYFKLDRDYAAYISNAYYLIQNGGFFSEALYPERLLSIVNGVYTPSFLIGYSLYLAIFVSILGNGGLILGNLLALIIGFIFIEKIYRIIAQTEKTPLILSMIIFFNPAIFWLYTYTYSETLFIPIIWGAIMSFMIGVSYKKLELLFLAWWGVMLSFSVRVEGLGLILTFGLAIFIMAIRYTGKWKQKTVYIALSSLILIGILGATLLVSREYVMAQFQDVSRTVDIQDQDNTISDTKERLQLMLLSLGTYLILIPILWIFVNRKLYTNKNIYWIFLLLLPFAIYLYNPRITRDFPWLLRRYITAIIPAILILGTWGISYLLRNRTHLKHIGFGIYMIIQILFIGILIQDRVDQRQYYRELSEFFEAQDLPQDTIVYMRGDFDRANELTRIIPYIQSSQNEIIFRSTYLDELFKKGGYLVDTVAYPEDDTRLQHIDSFSSTIETFKGQKESRFYSTSKNKQDLTIYLYQINSSLE